MKKKTIHFSDKMLLELKELSEMLGVKDTFGEIPQCLQFSLSYTLARIKKDLEVLPDLEKAKFDQYLSLVKRLKNDENKLGSNQK